MVKGKVNIKVVQSEMKIKKKSFIVIYLIIGLLQSEMEHVTKKKKRVIRQNGPKNRVILSKLLVFNFLKNYF